MKFWQKLTISMQKSDAWVAFANALEAVNDATVEPIIKRMKALPNLYEMQEDDVAVHFKELGEIFTVGRADVIDRPLLLQQRLDELHFKGHMYPIEKTLLREFGDIGVSWQVLYAPTDVVSYPYPQILRKETRISYNDAIESWFKTSRSKIEVVFLDVVKSYGQRYAGAEIFIQFASDLNRVVKPLIPTHIVFEGIEYIINSQMNIYRASSVQLHAKLFGEPFRPELEDIQITTHRGASIQVNAALEGSPYYGN